MNPDRLIGADMDWSNGMTKRMMPRMRRTGGSRNGNILVGCLVVLGIVLILLIAGGLFVYLNWRNWAGSAMQAGTTALVRQLDTDGALPPGEGDEMIVQFDRLTTAFKANEISLEEFGSVVKGIAESRVFEVLYAYVVELKYIPESGLTDEEKAGGQLAMQRAARGFYDQKIDRDQYKAAMSAVIGTDANGNPTIKDPDAVSDADLRATIASCAKAADEAGVSENPVRVDLSDGLKEKIDAVLGESSEPAPTEPVPPAPTEAVPLAPHETEGHTDPESPAEGTHEGGHGDGHDEP